MRSLIAAIALTVTATGTAQAADFDPQQFLAEKCSGCHGTEVYSRPNPRVKNLAGLEAQVRRCDANIGTGLFEDDIAALVEHLNASYYKF